MEPVSEDLPGEAGSHRELLTDVWGGGSTPEGGSSVCVVREE